MQHLAQIEHLLSDRYIPTGPDDFIGPSRKVARQLANFIALANASGRSPLRVMLNGHPGVGKSAMVRYAQSLLGVHPKWSTYKFSGVDVSVEKLRDLAGQLHLRDLFGEWRLIWIEEADRIPTAAQVRFLMLLDEMPPGTAVLCTSNCKVSDFDKRFETRFKFPEAFIQAPTAAEIEQFIAAKLGPHPGLRTACEFACGNVRAALNDAIDLYLNTPAAAQAA